MKLVFKMDKKIPEAKLQRNVRAHGNFSEYVPIFLILSFSIFFLLGTFIFGQVLRERDLSNLETIDRYILSVAGIEYISKNFTYKEHLIGMPYGSEVNAGKYMSNAVRDYLYAENNKKIFPFWIEIYKKN